MQTVARFMALNTSHRRLCRNAAPALTPLMLRRYDSWRVDFNPGTELFIARVIDGERCFCGGLRNSFALLLHHLQVHFNCFSNHLPSVLNVRCRCDTARKIGNIDAVSSARASNEDQVPHHELSGSSMPACRQTEASVFG